jgi:hypothetical protein
VIETVLFVPLTDNEGGRFGRRDWDALEGRLVAFGGFSRTANVQGRWYDSGRIYADTSRQYVVALASWWQLPIWLEIVDWARVIFRQEALYVKVAGIAEIRGTP